MSEENELDCQHEFVLVEYSSQSYGHCESCDSMVIKNEEDNWVYP